VASARVPDRSRPPCLQIVDDDEKIGRIQNYFLRELQMVHEWKKVIDEERLHLVESMIPLLDHKDEELQEALEVSRHEVEFQRRTVERYEHGSGSGGGE
jgi:hypothetical protein